MRRLVLLLTFAGSTITTQAQLHPAMEQRIRYQETLTGRLLQAQHSSAALKPTGTQYRLIAQAGGSIYNETPDSTRFWYSGSRGSRYNYAGPSFYYAERIEDNAYAPVPMLLDLTNDPATVQPDSSRFFSPDVPHLRKASYRPDNKIMVADFLAEGTVNRRLNIYNSQGYVTTTYKLYSGDNGASFDTVNKRVFTYNAAFTRVATDTNYLSTGPGVWMADNVLQYHYNATNHLDSVIILSSLITPLARATEIRFSYYPDQKLKKTVLIDKTLPYSTTTMIDSLGYTTGIDYPTSQLRILHMTDDELGAMTDTLWQSRYPGSNSLPDSVAIINSGVSFGTNYRISNKADFSYTSFNEPDKLLLYKNGELGGRINFYYEPYETTVGIRPLTAGDIFSVYPNPFSDDLQISWKGADGEAATIKLLNIMGQTVYSNDLRLNKGNNAIGLPQLSAGQYLLWLQDEKGRAQSSKVLKQ